ncbi:hypothetical protein EYF80_062826 [Liparis tanakae]|uniref:Uncharacterized protein n=1 Tax=Liparis tanakae TaxID=230148 RepID=A0A4Z2EFE3_9TELE|nr:hypothetical protein EYF80_062826 [Liparis tanakae]
MAITASETRDGRLTPAWFKARTLKVYERPSTSPVTGKRAYFTGASWVSVRVARSPDQWVRTHLEGFRGTADGRLSGPHDLRLVFLHGGKNDDSAAQTHRLAFVAKGHFEFVNDGCFKGDAVLSAETVCGGQI